jgi:gas vesicle protein
MTEKKGIKKILEGIDKSEFIITYEISGYVRPRKSREIAYTREEAESQIRNKLESWKSDGKIEWYKIISVKTYAEENP